MSKYILFPEYDYQEKKVQEMIKKSWHEIYLFFQDGLHEDVNRVRDKPYTVLEENHDGRPDSELAAEAWDLHLKRNQSGNENIFIMRGLKRVIEKFFSMCGSYKSNF